MYRLGWFSTGRGEGSLNLLNKTRDAIKSGHLPAEIAFVFCNREQGEAEGSDRFIKTVQQYKIPLLTLSYRRFRRSFDSHHDWRRHYFSEVSQLVSQHPFDLGVLAGFMLIVSEQMCTECSMINLHPAAPGGPKGTWEDVIWQLIEKDASENGCYMHLVTPELDAGPVVTYCKFSIKDKELKSLWEQTKGQSVEQLKQTPGAELPLFKAIRQKGIVRESPLVIETLRSFATGQVSIKEGRILDNSGKNIDGYDLTSQIEAKLKAGTPE